MRKLEPKKNLLILIQGKELVYAYQNSENKKLFIQKNYPKAEIIGKVLIKEFGTQKDMEIYLQGVEDAEGWYEYYIIEDNEAQEICEFLEPSRVYVVREHFYLENMEEDHRFAFFAGQNSYERAIFFLTETANAHDTFIEFLEKDDDFREKTLYWEIEEQTLEMWSAESIDLIDSIQELGNYAEKCGELNYKVSEVDYGVTAYCFESV